VPLFDYECNKCEHIFERIVSLKDADSQTCPKCDHTAQRKLTTSVGLKFKGNWYTNNKSY